MGISEDAIEDDHIAFVALSALKVLADKIDPEA